MQRNLIAHIYPRREGGHWRRTVEKLVSRWDLITGRAFVGVACDHSTESTEAVQDAFGTAAGNIEFTTVPNTGFQEVETFHQLLPKAIECPGVTTYVHSKGCTHASPSAASHVWREVMLEINFDYPDLLACALERFPMVGAFRSVMSIGTSRARWHYAGTIWTFRNEDLRSRGWQTIDQTYYGVESYPGLHFDVSESCCLFWPKAETAKLYDRNFWNRSILPAISRWREELVKSGFDARRRSHTLTARPIDSSTTSPAISNSSGPNFGQPVTS